MFITRTFGILSLIIIRTRSFFTDIHLDATAFGSLCFLPLIPVVPFLPVISTDFYPRDTPTSYLKEINNPLNSREQNSPRKPVLICFGDSLTHGSVSANWVDRVAARHTATMTVLNAGVNSETSRAARFRLEDIIAVQPDMVTILLGTNDLIGSLDDEAATMYQNKLWWAHRNKRPTLDLYEKELRYIVQELDKCLAPSSKIALLSPPPLGEGGFGGVAWEKGATLAATCEGLCKICSSDRLHYIPLFEKISNQMINKKNRRNESIVGQEFSFSKALPLTSVIVPWRLLLGESFDTIRQANGFQYTIDSVHFAEDFAAEVESLVCEWIEKR